MRKRVLSFLLAASAAFCFIYSSAPEAQAIVPIGFVQSALASYVSSTGYKLYNDNGTGQDILGSLGELYDDYVTIADKTITGQLANLAFLANSPYVYQDNSGQIVISKVAADIFQDFSDWIQTEYSVPVGSDSPTEVVQPSSSGLLINGSPVYVYEWDSDSFSGFNPSETFNTLDWPLKTIQFTSNYSREVHAGVLSDEYTLYTYNQNSRMQFGTFSSGSSDGVGSGAAPFNTAGAVSAIICDTTLSGNPTRWVCRNPSGTWVLLRDLPPSFWNIIGSGSLVSGLGVTLAQAVADVVGQAKEDDAVVIGVGASAGATAQDIADMVAQGVKAQTLDPSVSITAEAVIDTPVQPYPDIDGLGLPTLGAALVDRFPFCIPWDFVDTVKLLSADPQPINIKVDLIPQRIKTSVGITSDTSFDIDLSGEQYAKIGVFCRWGSLITFCFGLFLLTKRLVWTA